MISKMADSWSDPRVCTFKKRDFQQHVIETMLSLRHLIPPAVRAMQEELKNMLQGIISEQFNKVQTANEQLNNFLKSMNLPMAIQGLSAAAVIPDELWTKIEAFQKEGSAQNFSASIASNEQYVQINREMVAAIENDIN